MTHGDHSGQWPPPSAPEPRRSARRTPAGAVAPAVLQQIDENLKRLYRLQVEQDLPPALAALVARLRAQEAPAGDHAPGAGSDAGRPENRGGPETDAQP